MHARVIRMSVAKETTGIGNKLSQLLVILSSGDVYQDSTPYIFLFKYTYSKVIFHSLTKKYKWPADQLRTLDLLHAAILMHTQTCSFHILV